MSDDNQLDLFGPPPEPEPEPWDPELLRVARALPPHVRMGTSSWTFPGWEGMVYRKPYKNQKAFTRDSLAEYAQYPLFGTAGVDRSHYAPLTEQDWRAYAEQLPGDFRLVSKVWDEFTVMTFPDHPRYGERKGKPNPYFMDAPRFMDEVAEPLLSGFAEHTGPLVLEVAPMRRPPDPRVFEDALEGFLKQAPAALHYAVELRNPTLLTPRYLDILQHYAASHVLNFHTLMPTLDRQMALPGVLPGPSVVARLMIPPRQGYAKRKQDLAPFNRIADAQPAMREHVIQLIEKTGELGHTLFIIVNNKAEGSAPLTVRALAELWDRTHGG